MVGVEGARYRDNALSEIACAPLIVVIDLPTKGSAFLCRLTRSAALITMGCRPGERPAPTMEGLMPTELATIKRITVIQDDDGRVHWTSGVAIDADGSNGQNGNPFAYRADNKGLDANKNAGWPNKGWRNVLLDGGNGKPLSDGNGNWYSQTTYAWKGQPIPTRYVDATAVPYAVVNPIVRLHATGVVIGCRARISYNGQTCDAVVADVSGAGDIGELSIRAAELLGIPPSPRSGGVTRGVQFELWPGTAAVLQGQTYELQRA